MSTIVQTVESVLKSVTESRINYLEALYGYPCKVYKVRKNVYSEVYGSESGEELGECFKATLLITGDTMTPIDCHSAGTLQEGWVFTNNPNINTSDRIDIQRADGRTRRYKVDSQIALGTYTTVMKKFRIVALGD